MPVVFENGADLWGPNISKKNLGIFSKFYSKKKLKLTATLSSSLREDMSPLNWFRWKL